MAMVELHGFMASLILIRGQLFPFTVKREEKAKYINALEQADILEPQELVTFFCTIQKRNIENALNYRTEKPQSNLLDIGKLFSEKIEALILRKREQRQMQLEAARTNIFNNIYELLGVIQRDII